MYHNSGQVMSRSQGKSATAAAAYRSGARIEDQRTGEIHDYTRKSGVDSCEIMAPASAPGWAHDRNALWNEVERVEKRADSQLAREFNVAIPTDLSREGGQQAIRDWVQDQFVDRGMVADVAFHDLDSHNPHAHVMLTMRHIDEQGFGKKAREWNDRALMHEWRESWADYANAALEAEQCLARIDHRSYADQGLDREPTQHMGPAAAAAERDRPGSTRIGRKNMMVEARNEERAKTEEVDEIELEFIQDELDAIDADWDLAEFDWLMELYDRIVRPFMGREKQAASEPPESPEADQPAPGPEPEQTAPEAPSAPALESVGNGLAGEIERREIEEFRRETMAQEGEPVILNEIVRDGDGALAWRPIADDDLTEQQREALEDAKDELEAIQDEIEEQGPSGPTLG